MDTDGCMMDLSFVLVCHHCGKPVEEASRLYPKRGEVYVVPCSDCLDDADSRGYDRGHDNGYSDGYSDGTEAGETAVRDDIKAMLTLIKEESECAESKAGAISVPDS